MKFNQKLKELRLEKGWTQEELADSLKIHRMRVSVYERGKATPETKVLIKMSEIFNVSLDYLVFGNKEGQKGKVSPTADIKDRDLLRQFEELDKISFNEKELIKGIIELALWKYHTQKVVSQG
ncbi:MAG: helix-turn-helix transcriptional regulator [Deltaproteobacteria bacterium]|nr:helix-turn-helix transcriptional regulator [Deltaproteobacteria bacterium]